MTSCYGVLCCLGIMLLGGCTSLWKTGEKVDMASQAAEATIALTERNATNGAVVRSKRQRLAGEEIVVRSNIFPPMFDEPASYVTKGSQSLVQSLEDISAATGIPIKTAEIAQLARPGFGLPGVPMGVGGPGGMGQAGPDPISGTLVLEYSGTTRGLFDEIANKGNITWRYNSSTKAVEFYRYETRTLSVYVPASAKRIAAGISLSGVSGGGGAAGGGGGGVSNAGNVAVSQSLTIDPWGSIMSGIRAILSDAQGGLGQGAASPGAAAQSPVPAAGGVALAAAGVNGSAIANPELGLITVTARPVLMERVARYVSSINARFSKNVLIDVKIYSVSLDQQSSLGFSLDMLYTQINKYGGSIVGPAPLRAGSDTPGILTISSTNASSRWNGSTLVAEALSQFGKVALQTQGQVLAVNGQPSPIQVANEISYVASSATTQSPNVGSTTTQTPGVKVVGFTANFVPLILGDNRILLSYQMQISALAAPLTPNAQGVVTPNIASQSMQQEAFVRDGQAIVLFGFDQKRDSRDSSASIGGLSGSSRNERQMIVIVMQVNTGSKNGEI